MQKERYQTYSCDFSVQNNIPNIQASSIYNPWTDHQVCRGKTELLPVSVMPHEQASMPFPHTIITCSILPFSHLSSSKFTQFVQGSVKCCTFQAFCPDLFQVEGTFSFPKLTKCFICAFLMALSTSVTGFSTQAKH